MMLAAVALAVLVPGAAAAAMDACAVAALPCPTAPVPTAKDRGGGVCGACRAIVAEHRRQVESTDDAALRRAAAAFGAAGVVVSSAESDADCAALNFRVRRYVDRHRVGRREFPPEARAASVLRRDLPVCPATLGPSYAVGWIFAQAVFDRHRATYGFRGDCGCGYFPEQTARFFAGYKNRCDESRLTGAARFRAAAASCPPGARLGAWARGAVAACATLGWEKVANETRDALRGVPADAAGPCADAYRDRLAHNQVAIRTNGSRDAAAVFYAPAESGGAATPYLRALRLAARAALPVVEIATCGCRGSPPCGDAGVFSRPAAAAAPNCAGCCPAPAPGVAEGVPR